MISKLVEHNKLLDSLVQNSAFTNVQIDTLLSYVTVKQTGGKLDQMISIRDKNNITKGSFLHTLRQAQDNLKSSVYTILVIGYLGLINEEFVEGFSKIVRLLNRIGENGLFEDHNNVIDVINQLCDRLSSV